MDKVTYLGKLVMLYCFREDITMISHNTYTVMANDINLLLIKMFKFYTLKKNYTNTNLSLLSYLLSVAYHAGQVIMVWKHHKR